jgi:D-alanyl-D-alanine carboxypeptidase/D-alanyl-D-alanine-endopeptidase (penicillin-binding protein 4)
MRALLVALLLAAPCVAADEPQYQAVARATLGRDQGVFVEANDGTVLAALNAERPVYPASIAKIATTLALLQRLGPQHRFATAFRAGGALRDGTLAGPLLVEADGDPAFVVESADLVRAGLRTIGLRRVEGPLTVRGRLFFNWHLDPRGARLRLALATGDGGLVFAARGRRGPADGAPLVVHHSAPLAQLLKALNCYSNNVFQPFSMTVGGPAAVERIARASVAAPLRAAVTIDDAAGAGRATRLSPHATVALLHALDRELASHGLALPDVLPIAGVDPGTLAKRFDDTSSRGAVAAKTGSFGSRGASALAGVLRTRTHGRLTFAVLNRGLPVAEARRRQDAFVHALLADAGALALPPPQVTLPRPQDARVDVGAAPSAPPGLQGTAASPRM